MSWSGGWPLSNYTLKSKMYCENSTRNVMRMRQTKQNKTDWQTDRQVNNLSHFNKMTMLIYLLSCMRFSVRMCVNVFVM